MAKFQKYRNIIAAVAILLISIFMFFTIPFASLKAQISHEKACCVSPLICL